MMKAQHDTRSIGLEFYLENKISPVHQNIKDLNRHFEIRESLYRMLGLLPQVFYSKTVLEVAAGSGHNSLYISSLLPEIYEICEPNPVAVQDIQNLYLEFNRPHVQPIIHCTKLEDLKSNRRYDIVICEGWLGGVTQYEQDMLLELSEYVSPFGILIISYFPPIGAIASVLRRLLSIRLISVDDSIDCQTMQLREAFSSHLNTLPHLSRNHEHWIQDSLLNPHIYVGPLWPRNVFSTLGESFVFYNSVPNITTDWRWYKSLYANKQNYNNQYLAHYDTQCHNLIDYRFENAQRLAIKNCALENLCIEFILNSKKYELSGMQAYRKNIGPILKNIIENLSDLESKPTLSALREAATLLQNEAITSVQVSDMQYFSYLFGREQCYLSLTKQH